MSQNSIFREYIFVHVGPKFEILEFQKLIATKNNKLIKTCAKGVCL